MSVRPYLRPLLRHGRFGRLWLAYTVSTVGSQFHLVALTWSVIRLVGSASALGAVLMVGALPRAVLILAGGIISDRFPPAFVLVSSQLVRAVLSGALALLVANNILVMPHLFLAAVLFGIAEAFSFPASSSLIPTIVGRELIQPANGILQGSAYVAGLIGPACAGWLLAARGAASCFAIDAASFVIAAGFLVGLGARGDAVPAPSNWRAELHEVIRFAWHDAPLRDMLALNIVLNVAVSGPLVVGLAALASGQFAGRPAAFGTMLSASAGGLLAGSVAAGVIRVSRRGATFVALMAVVGLVMLLLTRVDGLPAVCVLLATLGGVAGLANVLVMSWIQTETPPALLGRTMGLLLFTSVGLAPISYGVAGLLVQSGLQWLFTVAGAAVLLACATATVDPAIRFIE